MNRIDRQHVLELKIPPAVLVALTGALMWLAATATSAAALAIPGRKLVTAILMLTGVVSGASRKAMPGQAEKSTGTGTPAP